MSGLWAVESTLVCVDPTRPTRFRELPIAPRLSDQPLNAAAAPDSNMNICHYLPMNAYIKRIMSLPLSSSSSAKLASWWFNSPSSLPPSPSSLPHPLPLAALGVLAAQFFGFRKPLIWRACRLDARTGTNPIWPHPDSSRVLTNTSNGRSTAHKPPDRGWRQRG
jgi:hypothetical protein